MMFIALVLLYSAPTYCTWFGYDSAIVAGQKGNWQNSKEQLKKELIDRSQSPELLYDAGVACFKTGEFDKALSYFKTVAEKPSVPKQLHEHAWFNVGNSFVELQKYQEAIDAYDQVLRTDPNNHQAAHNKEVVKKMLEQQKKEQEKKNEQQEKQDQQDNNDQKNEKKDDQQKNQNKDERKDQEKSSDTKKNDDMKQKEKQDTQEQQKKSQAEKDRKEKKEKESAGSAQEQKTKEQPSDKQEQIPGMTPLIAQFLDEQEKKDAQQNKKMMKAMVAKHGGAVNESNNNW